MPCDDAGSTGPPPAHCAGRRRHGQRYRLRPVEERKDLRAAEAGSAAWHPLAMLRKAEHARFQAVRVGGIVRKKMKTYFFPDKGNSRGREVSDRELRGIRRTQRSEPARV